MSFQVARGRRALLATVFATGLSVAPVGLHAAGGEAQIDVAVDQATLIRLPERIATLVVGNPLIADVTLQPGGMMVVTGKGYGATNVIALDRGGQVLFERRILVAGPADNLVTVYRGVERESYSCNPVCQRRVTLGDGGTYFTSTLDQAGSFANTASGNAVAAAANANAAGGSSSSSSSSGR